MCCALTAGLTLTYRHRSAADKAKNGGFFIYMELTVIGGTIFVALRSMIQVAYLGIALSVALVYAAYRKSQKDQDLLFKIYTNQLLIMATQAELAEQLNSVTTQIQKIGTEVTTTLQKVQELEDALGNEGEVSPALQTAFDNLKAQVTTVDNLIADAPVIPEEPVTPE